MLERKCSHIEEWGSTLYVGLLHTDPIAHHNLYLLWAFNWALNLCTVYLKPISLSNSTCCFIEVK